MKSTTYKAIMAIAFLLAFSFTVDAQINLKKLGNQVKRSAEQQVEQKIKEKAARETREALDRGEKKLDQGISNATSYFFLSNFRLPVAFNAPSVSLITMLFKISSFDLPLTVSVPVAELPFTDFTKKVAVGLLAISKKSGDDK